MTGMPKRRGPGSPSWREHPELNTVRPPFEPGNQLARRHGVWAADVDDEAAEVVGQLFDPSAVERYPAMALVAAQVWVRRRRALADIEKRGMVIEHEDGAPTPHPLLRFLGMWERTLMEASQRFGLDPRSDLDLRRAAVEATRAGFDLQAAIATGAALLDGRGGGDAA
jgi:hypothetical protein